MRASGAGRAASRRLQQHCQILKLKRLLLDHRLAKRMLKVQPVGVGVHPTKQPANLKAEVYTPCWW
jgi:hypothetical protein